MVNRITRYIKGGIMDEGLERLETLTKVEKEALCYRLLKQRDDINDNLRRVQQSLKDTEDA